MLLQVSVINQSINQSIDLRTDCFREGGGGLLTDGAALRLTPHLLLLTTKEHNHFNYRPRLVNVSSNTDLDIIVRMVFITVLDGVGVGGKFFNP